MPVQERIAHLEDRLRGGRRRFRNRLLLAGLWRAVTVSAAVTLFALLLGTLLIFAPYWYGPVAMGAALTVIAAFIYFVAVPWIRCPDLKAYARFIETKAPPARSLFVNALELTPAVVGRKRLHGGASQELASALVEQAELRSRDVEFDRFAPRAIPQGWGRTLAIVAALWLVGFLVIPGLLKQSGWGLLHPNAAIARGIGFEVWPGNVSLAPGSDLTVQVRVEGTSMVPELIARLDGEQQRIPMNRGEAPGSPAPQAGGIKGRAYTARLEAISSPGVYRVEIAGQLSPIYRIDLAGTAVPVSFDLTYEYPDYTGRPSEVQSVPRADLVALRGTRVLVGVNLDRKVQEVSWTLGTELVQKGPRRWVGETLIEGNGNYDVVIHDIDAPQRMTFRYEAIPDRAPVLTVLEPLGDMDLPVGQRIPLAVTATDDFGLTSLSLVYQVDGESPTRRQLLRWPDEPRETTAGKEWDLSPIGLLPGQQVSFFLEVRDNDRVSGPKVTQSEHFIVRFPTLSEIYEELEEQHEDVATKLDDVVEEARELAEQVEETRREMEQPTRGQQQGATWEQRQAAKELAERQQEIAERMQEVSDQFQEMTEQAAEREAFREEILAKMEEISKLMSELESPELREAMERLQQSLEQTNAQNLEQQLEQLELNQEELLRNLERTMELLKQIRQEERLEAAARMAEELAERQEALNQQMEDARSEEQREQVSQAEEQAASEASNLQEELDELAKELEESGHQTASEEAGEAGENLESEATPSMQQAAQQMRQGQRQQASQSGQKAQQSLSQVAQDLRDAAESMSQQVDQAQVEAVRRAAQDLVDLSQRQEESLEEGGEPRTRARRQQDLREGTQRVADDLFEVAKRTPFLSEDAARNLGQALQHLERSADAFDQGAQIEGERQGGSAAGALNKAVISLREAEQSMCQGGQQEGQQSGRQQMQQMVGQQGQLNRDTQSLSEQLAQQQRLMASDQNALQRLAARQEAIRKGIEEALNNRQEGDMLGRLDEVERDMEEVTRQLEQRRLDQEVLDRQQRILSRLLDAQRSVNRREFEQKRESRTGETVARQAPAELPRSALEPDARMNHDLLRARSERYSSEYRDLVESYLRRLQEER
jgi:hypothetical protein